MASLVLDLLLTVSSCIRGSHTVALALANNSWVSDIRGALMVPVISQFLAVWDWLVSISLVLFVYVVYKFCMCTYVYVHILKTSRHPVSV